MRLGDGFYLPPRGFSSTTGKNRADQAAPERGRRVHLQPCSPLNIVVTYIGVFLYRSGSELMGGSNQDMAANDRTDIQLYFVINYKNS